MTPSSAIVWARCERAGMLHVVLTGSAGDEHRGSATAGAARDLTAEVRFEGLRAGARYDYQALCDDGTIAAGRFRTAPDPHAPVPVRFAWGGDVGGQNVCRDRRLGYPIFETIVERRVDFFVALGDMVYADNPCEARGRFGNAQVPGDFGVAVDLPGFWAHWRYNRADRHTRRLLSTTSQLAVWDDHETTDDAGPAERLLPVAREAFLHYNPIDAETGALYRAVRWGAHVELFLLDLRSHRDQNARPDDPRRPKTMLGRAQLAWLRDGLRRSDATWKIIVSSVPLSIPTSLPERRDGWASGDGPGGFEHELLGLLAALADARVRNLLFLTTDVHHATGFRYRPFVAHPDFVLHELVTGPLQAGLYPRYDLDPTLRPERLFFFGPAPGDGPRSFADARAWFNFGVVDVEADGRLVARVVNGRGWTVFRQELR